MCLSNTFCSVAQKQFHKAMALVGEELLDRVSYYSDSWLPARSLVKEAISKRKQVGCFRNEEDNVFTLSLIARHELYIVLYLTFLNEV